MAYFTAFNDGRAVYRVDPGCQAMLEDKNICCFVKDKEPFDIQMILDVEELVHETDYYIIENRNGCMLLIHPDTFSDAKELLEEQSFIIQIQD